jgi:hypothetical protein
MTSSGIEPATVRPVTEWLDQQSHRVAHIFISKTYVINFCIYLYSKFFLSFRDKICIITLAYRLIRMTFPQLIWIRGRLMCDVLPEPRHAAVHQKTEEVNKNSSHMCICLVQVMEADKFTVTNLEQ